MKGERSPWSTFHSSFVGAFPKIRWNLFPAIRVYSQENSESPLSENGGQPVSLLEAQMTALRQDILYGFRQLLSNPGFAIIAALSLGLGIGANTTIFSLINTTLLRPLAF